MKALWFWWPVEASITFSNPCLKKISPTQWHDFSCSLNFKTKKTKWNSSLNEFQLGKRELEKKILELYLVFTLETKCLTWHTEDVIPRSLSSCIGFTMPGQVPCSYPCLLSKCNSLLYASHLCLLLNLECRIELFIWIAALDSRQLNFVPLSSRF